MRLKLKNDKNPATAQTQKIWWHKCRYNKYVIGNLHITKRAFKQNNELGTSSGYGL